MTAIKEAVAISAYHNMPDEYIERNALRAIQSRLGKLPEGEENYSDIAADIIAAGEYADIAAREHCGVERGVKHEDVQKLVSKTIENECVAAVIIAMQIANRYGIDLAQAIQEASAREQTA